MSEENQAVKMQALKNENQELNNEIQKLVEEKQALKAQLALVNHSPARVYGEEGSSDSSEESEDEVILSKKYSYVKKYVIINSEFQQMIEMNHSELLNKNGELIIPQPEYNEEGNMLISRTQCLQILVAYIKKNNLYDNEKINLDDTLYAIIPKSGKKVGNEYESTLKISDLMKVINELVESD